MSLSEAEIGLLVDEIAQLTGRATLQRILEPDERTLVGRFREPGATRFLAVSTAHELTRLHVVEEKPDQPGHPSAFAMLCRKWLHGAPFTDIEQVGGDRVVRMTFAAVDPRIRDEVDEDEELERRPTHLVCELAGRVGNVFLLDADDRIVGRQTDEAIASRDLKVGDLWEPPPPPPDSGVGSEVRWNLRDRSPQEFARSRRVAEAYRKRLEESRRDELRRRLESQLADQVDRLERRIEHVERDLKNVEAADKYRKWAELLQSAYDRVERGAESVRVPDFYREGMPEVEIPLDPSKSLQENIDEYYHEARRYEEAREMVEQRLLESVELRDRVIQRLDDLEERGEISLAELRELEAELRDEELLPRQPDHSDSERDRGRAESKPYKTFRARSDRRILVGKGASENDTLSTTVARGRDFWFHARDWPGAHVVLRLDNRDESPETDDLVDAATLAAHFSKGRNDTVVEVTYTRAKYVRKHGNLPPGKVSLSNEKTIAVQMEDNRLERLFESEEGEK